MEVPACRRLQIGAVDKEELALTVFGGFDDANQDNLVAISVTKFFNSGVNQIGLDGFRFPGLWVPDSILPPPDATCYTCNPFVEAGEERSCFGEE